jgi:MFS family permease
MLRALATRTIDFFRPPALPGGAWRTFRYHLAYALLDAAAGGILLNAPFMALHAMGGKNWQLPMRELLTGVGMLAGLYLGSWMARRPKMPFVFGPGVMCVQSTIAMSLVAGNAFWFLTFFGISAMFEVMTRPATAAILRLCYPASCRGLATGEVRKWSSLAFVVASLLSAWLLDRSADGTLGTARLVVFCAALLSLASFVCFRQIQVHEPLDETARSQRIGVLKHVCDAVEVFGDARYRRYLLACFVDGFCGMLYFPLIVAFFASLKFGYVETTVFVHAIPALTAFAITGWLGRWFDRTSPWFSWTWIRFAWGLDALLLAATPLATDFLLLPVVLLPLAGRLLRGSVQGGQWVLWWQVGVTHFAPPGQDTSRYVGVMVFLNGAIRLAASAAGIGLAAFGVEPATLLVIGGTGVVLSGVYSLRQAGRERREHQPETIAEFEAQFAGAGPRVSKGG